MDHSDDELLISRQADDNVEQEETGTGSSKWRFLLTLCLVLVVYKGSEEMAKATVKQFVYSWCEENVHAHPRSDHSKSPAGYGNSSHHGTETNHSVCGLKEETAAQKLASRWELYLNLLNTILLYFSVAIFGTLSDYLGRKLFFCLALAGWAARCGIISVIIYFDFHIGWMMFAYSVDGLCGSHYVISMLTFASTADRTHEAHERVFGIAVMEAVLGVGKFTTQFGNGYFIKRYGYFYPMCTSTGGTVLAFAIALLCLKDTTSTTTSGANSHSSNSASFLDIPSIKTLFRNYIGFYSSKGDNHERLIFWICLVAFLFTEFGQEAKSDPLTLYQLGSPFCWSSEIIGWYNTAQILVALVVGCLGLKVLQKCFTDPVICCIGTVSAIAYCTVTGIARTTVWLFIAIAFGWLMLIPKSILKGIASSRAASDLQGALFAGLKSSELICKLISGPASLSFYAATLTTNAGLVFLVLGGVYGISLGFMIYLVYLLRRHSRERFRASLGLETFIEEDE